MAVGVARKRDHACDLLVTGHVGKTGDGLAAAAPDLVDDRVERGLIAMAVDHKTRARVREGERDGAPDIAARTGDDGDTAGERLLIVRHAVLFPVTDEIAAVD